MRRAVAAGLSLLTLFLMTSGRADLLEHWSPVSPLPTSRLILAVAHANGILVAVGSGGVILTSSDGLSREVFPNVVHGEFRDVIWTEDRFIAVGGRGIFGNPPEGLVATSSDGRIWMNHPTGLNAPLYGVAHGNERFVAVGGDWSGGRIISSSDGVTWTERQLDAPILVQDVAFGGGVFVAVTGGVYPGYGGGSVLLSEDGTDWTANPVRPGWVMQDVVHNENGFFIRGEKDTRRHIQFVLHSPNGRQWDEIGFEESQDVLFDDTAFGSSRYVRAGPTGQIELSEDRANWRRVGSNITDKSLHVVVPGPTAIVAAGQDGTLLVSANGQGPEWSPASADTTAAFRDGVYGKGQFVLVGDHGTIALSTNTQNWNIRRLGNNTGTRWRIAFGNETFVAIGDDRGNTSVAASADGQSWTEKTLRQSLHGLRFGGGRFVACGTENGPEARGVFAYSEDGIDWTSQPSGGTNSYPVHLAYGRNLFVALPLQGNDVWRSTDGIEWETATLNGIDISVSSGISSLEFGDDQFIFMRQVYIPRTCDCSPATALEVWASEDGITWTQKTVIPESVTTIEWTSWGFVAVGDFGTIWRTGLVRFLPKLMRPEPPGNFTLKFVLGRSVSATIDASEDGRSWTPIGSVSGTNGVIELMDVSPPRSHRFYRASGTLKLSAP